jgi:hypothetical protein
MNSKMDLLVPVWFLLVGALGTMYPPTSMTAGLVSFVITLIVIPFSVLAVTIYGPRRLVVRSRRLFRRT